MASVNTSIEQERKKVIIITFDTNILYITFVNKMRGYVNFSNDLNLVFFLYNSIVTEEQQVLKAIKIQLLYRYIVADIFQRQNIRLKHIRIYQIYA